MKSVQQALAMYAIVYPNLFLLLTKAGVWAALAFVDLCGRDDQVLDFICSPHFSWIK